MKYIFSALLCSLLYSFSSFSQEPPPTPINVDRISGPVDSTDIFVDFPDIEAEYIGGAKALQTFIRENVHYPDEAYKNNISGRVYLKFTVEADGTISHIVVERGVHELLNNEAIRVVKLMPPWVPAELDSKKVPTKVRLPIIFNI